MKKLVLLVMSITLLLSTTVSVNAANEAVSVRPDGARVQGIEGLFEIYYPEGLSEFEALRGEHMAFHDDRKALRDDHRAYVDEEKAAVKAALASGEMTREEVRALIAAKKAEHEPLREALDALRVAKQEELEPIKASRDILKTNIMEALESSSVDTETMVSYLTETTELLKSHIAIDYKYATLVDAVIF